MFGIIVDEQLREGGWLGVDHNSAHHLQHMQTEGEREREKKDVCSTSARITCGAHT